MAILAAFYLPLANIQTSLDPCPLDLGTFEPQPQSVKGRRRERVIGGGEAQKTTVGEGG